MTFQITYRGFTIDPDSYENHSYRQGFEDAVDLILDAAPAPKLAALFSAVEKDSPFAPVPNTEVYQHSSEGAFQHPTKWYIQHDTVLRQEEENGEFQYSSLLPEHVRNSVVLNSLGAVYIRPDEFHV